MSYIPTEITFPTEVLPVNKFEVEDSKWDKWSDEAKKTFNYLYEMMERNEKVLYAYDLFPLTDFSTENKIIFHKIKNAANFNAAWTVADYVNSNFPVYPEKDLTD